MRSIESSGMVERSTCGHVDVVEPSAVDQDQRIGGGEGAESAEVDGGLRAVDAAKQARQLHARRLRDDFLAAFAPANARYPRR